MIPIVRPMMDEREAQAAGRVILSGWTTQGPEVAAFEKEFAALVGAEHACAVSSCTTALHLALLAVGVGPGDEVITVSHSFIATANAVRYCGATPVFVDVRSDTFNVDPAEIEKAITPRTKAVLAVHQMGMPCEMHSILSVANRYGLRVVEDAACASGSEMLWDGRWEKIGKPHGDIACFSFHPRKVISTGDGGMLTTGNAGWDQQFRLLRQHAMGVSDTVRHASDKVIFETYASVGYNYRMTDIQAAVGREQLLRLPGIVERRRKLAVHYGELLRDIKGLGLPHEPHDVRSNWQSFCVRLPAGCDQTAVMQSMLDAGVATRRGVMCSHREPAYRDQARLMALPRSESAQDTCIVLPMFPQLERGELEIIAAALKRACEGG